MVTVVLSGSDVLFLHGVFMDQSGDQGVFQVAPAHEQARSWVDLATVTRAHCEHTLPLLILEGAHSQDSSRAEIQQGVWVAARMWQRLRQNSRRACGLGSGQGQILKHLVGFVSYFFKKG